MKAGWLSAVIGKSMDVYVTPHYIAHNISPLYRYT